ncbi:hypothetical protein ACOSQ4_025290 [Xanthoceras sorbifolium]
MNRQIALMLARALGEVIEIPLEAKEYWGKFLRVKVAMNISKPLKRGVRVWIEEFGVMVVALVRYERLPDFCFACGYVGHSFRDCSNSEAKHEALHSHAPKFGSWLRAPPPERYFGRKQRGGVTGGGVEEEGSCKKTEDGGKRQCVEVLDVVRVEKKLKVEAVLHSYGSAEPDEPANREP